MDRFIHLDALVCAGVFGSKTLAHVRKVAQAQHGLFRQPRYSQNLLATYPRFVKAGNRWGVSSSEYERYRQEQRSLGKWVPPSIAQIQGTA